MSALYSAPNDLADAYRGRPAVKLIPTAYAVRQKEAEARMAAEIVAEVTAGKALTQGKTCADVLIEGLDVSTGTHYEVMAVIQRLAHRGDPDVLELVKLLAAEYAKVNAEVDE